MAGGRIGDDVIVIISAGTAPLTPTAPMMRSPATPGTLCPGAGGRTGAAGGAGNGGSVNWVFYATFCEAAARVKRNP
jgi:hypothetical protein